jgi:hypothetical protein
MLSIVVDADAAPLALSATLSPLVRGVVEGLVGSATLIARAEHEDVSAIADGSGCRLLISPTFAEGFARAMTYTSGSGVLVMDAGVQVGPEFWPVLADILPVLGQNPAVTQFQGGLLARLRLLGGRVSRDQALLLPGPLAREIGLDKSDPFTRAYGKKLVTLRAEARRVQVG